MNVDRVGGHVILFIFVIGQHLSGIGMYQSGTAASAYNT
jgi:hypothetical protein